jgi:hypothetical protein
VADSVDGISEDHVLGSPVAVRPHDDQIGLDLAGLADNGIGGCEAVLNGQFGLIVKLS